jgi:serine/threonine-protein kinase HipA
MRKAKILFRDEEAGVLAQQDDGSFTFTYLDPWLADRGKPAISLTFPKTREQYHSKFLFPFFFGMLPEGTNKQTVCRLNNIDPSDDFGLLMTAARYDTIGAVRVINSEQS